MTEFLIYQGKTAVILAVFYMFYRLLLSKDTFHRFNRIILLGTAALSLVLPLCVITIHEVVMIPAVQSTPQMFESATIGTMAAVAEVSEPIWPYVICAVFAIGALGVLLMAVVSIAKVICIIRSGEHHTLESSETLVITDAEIAPFSWMKYIVLSREDYENGYSQILTHEKAHIALKHSWDVLFVDMITALQWFNPAMWMLKADLRAIHEFEADDAVLRSGADVKEYQYLLIRKAVSKSGYSVANSFNHSTLKARITMMLNQKSSRMSAWKALYVIPLVGISLAATAETKVDYQYEGQEPEAMADTLVGKDNKNSFREKNLSEGRFIIDEEANSITMIYFDHNGNELRSQHKGMPLGQDEYYFHNGNMATPAAYEIYLKEEGAVTFTTYRSNGKKILGIVTPNNNYVTGVWDATKHPDEQETVYHMKDKQYKVRGGKYVEIEAPKIKVRDANGNEVKVSESNLVYVINGERMPEGFDLNTIDPATITSMEVLKTEKALQEYGTDKGVIVITTDPSKANEKKPVPDIYIDGKKATSEEVAALPANPKGYVEPDGTVQLITEEKSAEKKEPVPFQHLGQQPTFNGGNANEFSKWVAANLKYPEKCRQSKVQGRVTLQFTITEKGEVTDVRVLRGVNEELDKEALRVVSASPRWTPGKDKNGNIVPVIFTFPVLFQL